MKSENIMFLVTVVKTNSDLLDTVNRILPKPNESITTLYILFNIIYA